jgi:hypothetical protein
MTPFTKSTYKVDCPDGPRYFLKQPEKAFAITFPKWDARINALVTAYGENAAKLGASISKDTETIVNDLTENYAAMQTHYQAAYLGWCGNPCSKEAEKEYNKTKNMILENDFTLRKIEKDTSEMAEKLKAAEKSGKLTLKETARKTGRVPPPEMTIAFAKTYLENIHKLVKQLKV